MRISELARASAVPVATIKFYLREGLLPAGHVTSRTSATYGEEHLDRLRLLRVLREVGDVPISLLRQITAVLDSGDRPLMAILATGVDALNPPARDHSLPDEHPARAAAEAILHEAGWTNVRPDAPDRAHLADLLEVVMSFGTHEDRMEVLREYVSAADRIGRSDVNNLDTTQGPQDLLSEVVVGQVVFGEILLTLRRLAEEHYAFERLGHEPG